MEEKKRERKEVGRVYPSDREYYEREKNLGPSGLDKPAVPGCTAADDDLPLRDERYVRLAVRSRLPPESAFRMDENRRTGIGEKATAAKTDFPSERPFDGARGMTALRGQKSRGECQGARERERESVREHRGEDAKT